GDTPGRFRQRRQVGFDEIGAQQQIAWWIAAEKQLRRDDEFRAQPAGLVVGGEQLLPIGVEITNRRVELQDANLHWLQSSDARLIRNEFAPASQFNLASARNGAARQKFFPLKATTAT